MIPRATRRRLGTLLVERYPWLADDLGPAGVEPGDCDRCGNAPRLVSTCGPSAWRALCRDCLLEVGEEAFCAGHVDDAGRAVAMAQALPDQWATLTRLSWVASGQVRPDPAWLSLAAERLADKQVAALLPGEGPADVTP